MAKQAVQYAIGIDLGGTKIEMGVVDDRGHIHQQKRLETWVSKGAKAVESQIIEGIRELNQKAKVPILGIGIGAAGQIHPTTGEVIFAPNLKWKHVPLQANLENALNLPVRILNDVRAITLGEWKFGSGKGSQDLICIFIGTGIGSGVVSDGQLLHGCSNTLGEIGHMTINFNGPVCSCGKKGCFEAYASGWGIAARAKDLLVAEGKAGDGNMMLKLAHGQRDAINAIIVAQAFREGDPLAKKIIVDTKEILIAGIASIINAFNPCRLILGGGLIDGIPELIEGLDQGVRQIALKAAVKNLEIVRASLGKGVGIIGSAAHIFNLFQGHSK